MKKQTPPQLTIKERRLLEKHINLTEEEFSVTIKNTCVFLENYTLGYRKTYHAAEKETKFFISIWGIEMGEKIEGMSSYFLNDTIDDRVWTVSLFEEMFELLAVLQKEYEYEEYKSKIRWQRQIEEEAKEKTAKLKVA